MESKASASASGVGFAGALAILFIAFKLAGVIAWPWRWVLAPIWIFWALAIVTVIVCLTWMLCRGNKP